MVSHSPFDRLLGLDTRYRQQGTQSLLQTDGIGDLEYGLPFGLRPSDIVQLEGDLSCKVAEQVFLQAEFQSLLGLVKSRERVGIGGSFELPEIFKYLRWAG